MMIKLIIQDNIHTVTILYKTIHTSHAVTHHFKTVTIQSTSNQHTNHSQTHSNTNQHKIRITDSLQTYLPL